MTDLELSHASNLFKSQYVNKRFNNKHARSSWRHYSHKKYWKKWLLRQKRQTVHNYLNMEYDDIVSDYQQYLDDKYAVTDLEYHTAPRRIPPRSDTQKITQAARALGTFVSDLCASNGEKTDDHLWHLHLKNYETNCDESLFLDYKNWFLYQMSIDANVRLRRMFGSKKDENSDIGPRFLRVEYFGSLSTVYYESSKNNASNSRNTSNTNDLKCIEMKDMHCNLILDAIYSMGEAQMNTTLSVVYYSIPYASFSTDICMVIIEYMGAFPQTPPEPARRYYIQRFSTREYFDGSIPSMFYISQQEMIYPLKYPRRNDDDNITCAWHDFDTQEIGFLYDELHPTNVEGYVLNEIYHLWFSWQREFVLVGKLKSISRDRSREVFIYWDYSKYNGEHRALLLSAFWNDLWERIPSDCIKADCYNTTKLPKLIQTPTAIKSQNTITNNIIYDYEY